MRTISVVSSAMATTRPMPIGFGRRKSGILPTSQTAVRRRSKWRFNPGCRARRESCPKHCPVTPGHDFRFDVDLHVKPGTETGFLIVFFFDGSAKVLSHLKEPLLSGRLEPDRALRRVRRLRCTAWADP
jgi:hypothetical protein